MNKRIREIAEQAVKDVDVVHEDNPFNEELAKMYIPNVFIERFAELIVQECADLCSKYGDRVEYNRPNSGYEAWECADIIKQHFGVEE